MSPLFMWPCFGCRIDRGSRQRCDYRFSGRHVEYQIKTLVGKRPLLLTANLLYGYATLLLCLSLWMVYVAVEFGLCSSLNLRLCWVVCVSVLRVRVCDIYIASNFGCGVEYVVSVVADGPWIDLAGMTSGFGEGWLCIYFRGHQSFP